MEFENHGTYYAVWEIKQDLAKEKNALMDMLYSGSLNGFYGAGGNNLSEEESLRISVRIEEITRILQGIKLGYYNSP